MIRSDCFLLAFDLLAIYRIRKGITTMLTTMNRRNTPRPLPVPVEPEPIDDDNSPTEPYTRQDDDTATKDNEEN